MNRPVLLKSWNLFGLLTVSFVVGFVIAITVRSFAQISPFEHYKRLRQSTPIIEDLNDTAETSNSWRNPEIRNIMLQRKDMRTKLCAAYNAEQPYKTTETKQRDAADKLKRTLIPIPKLELLWCIVPKVASTSLGTFFLENLGLKLPPGYSVVHTYTRDIFPSFNSSEFANQSSKLTSFLVTRHPFVRILSAYREKLEDKKGLHENDTFGYIGQTIVKFNRPKDVFPSQTKPSFLEFLNYIVHAKIDELNEHWRPIYNLCQVCEVPYDITMKFENLEEELQFIQFTNLRNIPLPRMNTNLNSTSSLLRQYFSKIPPQLLIRIYKLYELDFLLFDYQIPDFLKLAILKTDMF